MFKSVSGILAASAFMLLSSSAMAGPETVAGPGADPACFKPLTAETKFFQWPAKPGPYRIALANGFIANDWRVQMIKVAKAYASQPDVAKDIKEFKVVSVGQDVAAQIAAVNNFIDQGYDAIIVNANSTSAFRVGREEGERRRRCPAVVRQRHRRPDATSRSTSIRWASAVWPANSCSRRPRLIPPSSCSCAVPPASRWTSRAPRASTLPRPLRAARSK